MSKTTLTTEIKIFTCNKELVFSSAQFKCFVDRKKIKINYCDPRHSTMNGQKERSHSTIIEIAKYKAQAITQKI